MTSQVRCYLLFLSYILPIINNLNKEFQSERSRLPYLYSSIKSNFLLILSNFIKKELVSGNTEYMKISNQLDVSYIFIGTKAESFAKENLTSSEIVEVESDVLKFYIELLDQLNRRFDFDREDIKQ